MGCVKIWMKGDQVPVTAWKVDGEFSTADMVARLRAAMTDGQTVEIMTDHRVEVDPVPTLLAGSDIGRVDPVSESMEKAMISVAENGFRFGGD